MSEPKEVSLLEVMRRVHRGELTPEEAVQILTASEPPKPAETSA